METGEVIEICREAMYVLVIMSAPAMITALVVGLAIALFQALTQIQEATLTFVPKILAVFIILAISASFMVDQLVGFTAKLEDKIIHIQ